MKGESVAQLTANYKSLFVAVQHIFDDEADE